MTFEPFARHVVRSCAGQHAPTWADPRQQPRDVELVIKASTAASFGFAVPSQEAVIRQRPFLAGGSHRESAALDLKRTVAAQD